MVLPIIKYGDPILRKVSTDVPTGYAGLNDLIKNMFDTLKLSGGIGLAAPQIGVNLKIFIVLYRFMPKIFINPIIYQRSGESVKDLEGCLSIPRISAPVLRKNIIKITYQDEYLNPRNKMFTGFKARIIQHEYDHLEGILYIDHLSSDDKDLISPFL